MLVYPTNEPFQNIKRFESNGFQSVKIVLPPFQSAQMHLQKHLLLCAWVNLMSCTRHVGNEW